MLIASKYEEIYAPEVKDFVYITDKAYSKDQILELEQKMLNTLSFNVTTPSSYRFLERFFKVSKSSDKVFSLAQYLLELGLNDYKLLKHKPNIIASAALFLAMKIFKKPQPWSTALEKHTGFDEPEIRPCAKDLCFKKPNRST